MPLHAAYIAIVSQGLYIGAMFELAQLLVDGVVLEIAVASEPCARLGLAIITVALHSFPAMGQPDEFVKVARQAEVCAFHIGKLVLTQGVTNRLVENNHDRLRSIERSTLSAGQICSMRNNLRHLNEKLRLAERLLPA